MIAAYTDAQRWALEFTRANQLEHELSEKQSEVAQLLTEILRLQSDIERVLGTIV